MSELPSALFSIADGSEFRFTRFYIVCEAVPLGAPESPLIVCGFAGHTPGTVQTRKDTEPDVRRGMVRNPRILLQRIAAPVAFWNFIFSDILIIKHVPFQIFLLEGKKKTACRTAVFLGEGIFTMGYSKNYI